MGVHSRLRRLWLLMARSKVTFVIDERAIARMNAGSGQIYRGVQNAAGWVRDEGRKNVRDAGRTDTGRLQNSIMSWQAKSSSSGVTFRVGSRLRYAIYQHEGVDGPVYPRRAKVLRFKPKGAGRGQYVFAQRTKGFKGSFFMKKAKDRLSPRHYAP